ncbi:tRNA pseudouridine synthase A [Paenibacillus darwinianus]|uniref:tRNA pseudouridine synthase A n=1 Tax=Paenibacillus darwinianus TaxID=1380763 RepID=A0A9W5W820_9BACL|nr:tRNA pseudouridine(38-40) synthase TruA [Paenibacillus darwinianus]EXX88985.1 tRNA pseudouridine synthase A [Paenibacillus darwinianus]EXX89616.1 tRNA pseudouridine synthase A [Paenibacillus darwinianus]EXX90298.1 tRNA pseudouridine synthase A [Paenibacillus darwinianus]
MRNIAMVVSYDGGAYQGFQSQPSGLTVQDELEKAIRRLSGQDVRLDGSGRTDAGVHAQGQVINFLSTSPIPVERWAIAMNGWLPHDIVVRSAHEMPEAFSSRKSAIRKTYRYSISTGKHPNVFNRRFRYHHYNPLDVEAMRVGIRHLLGEHDFSSFTSAGSTKKSHVRTVYEVRIERDGPDIHLFITGNGFLYNMVRIVVGTLLWVGEGKWKPDCIGPILAARDRSKAGPRAEAHGLVLWEVRYPEPFQMILDNDPASSLWP